MNLLDEFIDEFKKSYLDIKYNFDDSLNGKIKQFASVLLDDDFLPSSELKSALNDLILRTTKPMQIAITGQFSSGKSTFLNALLKKNILPTGITPVTSKVNYIKYGDEFKIKVRFFDGTDAYHDIDDISRFTDQRGEVQNIKYLTLYAPFSMLKDISFVDTPGLNSQSQLDTSTTQEVLKKVDGIIWLSLIDNAGKMSEAKTLQEYLSSYANKSLCVLNQKDKFSDEEVQKSLNYVKQNFKDYFSEVVAISAIQALQARSSSSEQQFEILLEKFLHNIKNEAKSPTKINQTQNLEHILADFKSATKTIYSTLQTQNDELLKSSNIDEILRFISQQIQPQAKHTKQYAIIHEAKKICDSLITQQKNIIDIYLGLDEILDEFEQSAKNSFENAKINFSKELKNAFKKIEDIIDKIASQIFDAVFLKHRFRYEKKQIGLLNKQTFYTQIPYEVSQINSDDVYKKLFYHDDIVGKMFKKYVKELKMIQNLVNEKNLNIYKDLEQKILKWQLPHELIEKTSPLHSNLEYANIRKFASKVYENFLKSFHDEISSSYAIISSEFNHLSSAVSFNYQNATEVCVAFLEHKINQSIELYEQDCVSFPLYCPNIEEIKQRLKLSFHLYELENLMNSNRTFLDKNYNHLLEKFSQTNQEKKEFLRQKINTHENKIKKILKLKEELSI